MNICLFSDQEISKPLSLRDPRGEHIVKILHKKEGDSFSAGIIGGQAGKATITKISTFERKSPDGKKTFSDGEIEFTFTPESDGKPLYPLEMIIGFPRPIQLKRLLRDMAGLGVEAVHLCVTELGEKSYLKSDLATSDAGKIMLLEGSQQAASTHVPKLSMHSSLSDSLKSAGFENKILLALDNVNPSSDLFSHLADLKEKGLLNKDTKILAAIGSERGWTENERREMEEKGFIRLSMGKRVLRTETASTVAASLILAFMGFLD